MCQVTPLDGWREGEQGLDVTTIRQGSAITCAAGGPVITLGDAIS